MEEGALTEEEREAADPWLTLAEIAEELRVNPATVRLWVSKGQLKASRAGVRKWIVRRSDLERMLAATNPSRGEAHERSAAGRYPAPVQPRTAKTVGEDEPTPKLLPPVGTRESVARLVQSASDSLDDAFNASAYAPPGPGYLDRVRAIAEACEHFAATSLHASRTAGVSWKGRSDFGPDRLPYELRPNGNRPRRAGLWDEFDAAVAALAIAMTGQDMTAVAEGFREVSDALGAVADELERDDSWRVADRTG
jgi:excisionase family DNA binding protein